MLLVIIHLGQAYISNMSKVQILKITKTEITMINGDIVPISRKLYDEVHSALIKYL